MKENTNLFLPDNFGSCLHINGRMPILTGLTRPKNRNKIIKHKIRIKRIKNNDGLPVNIMLQAILEFRRPFKKKRIFVAYFRLSKGYKDPAGLVPLPPQVLEK